MMKIQKATHEDLVPILELQKLCYIENAERYNDFNISPLTQSVDELKMEYDKGVILVAIDGNKIVGSIRACEKGDTCYIGKLIVHPNFQNKGIGSSLLGELESYFENVCRYELFTGFKDEKNLYLYKKLGYEEYERKLLSDDFIFVFLEKQNNSKALL